jgi:hypothetical protein
MTFYPGDSTRTKQRKAARSGWGVGRTLLGQLPEAPDPIRMRRSWSNQSRDTAVAVKARLALVQIRDHTKSRRRCALRRCMGDATGKGPRRLAQDALRLAR